MMMIILVLFKGAEREEKDFRFRNCLKTLFISTFFSLSLFIGSDYDDMDWISVSGLGLLDVEFKIPRILRSG